MRILTIMVGLLCLTSCEWFDSNSSQTPNLIPATDDMICEREPSASLVGETVSTTKNPCEASAKIQAIAYECGNVTESDSFVQNAFKLNIEKARERCNEFCKDQDSSCEGDFSQPSDCGLKSAANVALSFGKNNIHCPLTCKGQAFNYCSIYHGSFFAVSDRSLFKDMKANCQCRMK
jgi:hypothetical protein